MSEYKTQVATPITQSYPDKSISILDGVLAEVKQKVYDVIDNNRRIKFQIDYLMGSEPKENVKEPMLSPAKEPESALEQIAYINEQLIILFSEINSNTNRLAKLTGK